MRIILKHFFSLIILSTVFTLSIFSGTDAGATSSSLMKNQVGMADVELVYGAPKDIRVSIIKVIQIVLGFLSLIFLILIVLAGFNYMTAAGNEDKVKKSIKQISQATIGLIIVISAWGISLMVLNIFKAASKGQDFYT
jgi:magnesium-transporting ATPase (P-type)